MSFGVIQPKPDLPVIQDLQMVNALVLPQLSITNQYDQSVWY